MTSDIRRDLDYLKLTNLVQTIRLRENCLIFNEDNGFKIVLKYNC